MQRSLRQEEEEWKQAEQGEASVARRALQEKQKQKQKQELGRGWKEARTEWQGPAQEKGPHQVC